MSEKSNDMLSKLGTWIIAATILGAIVGLVMGNSASMFAPGGNLFMQLIKMVIVPMVFFSLVSGAASLGNSRSAGKIGFLTFVYYALTTVCSVIIGIVLCEMFQPGAGINIATFGSVAAVGDLASNSSLPGFWDTIIGFVPVNPFKALVDGNILQVITFSLFLGFALSHFEGEKKDFLLNIFDT